ncbi:MAG: hypothetical protein M5U26_08585 [Planctomycetota bacterium]|nr:hypothetical protein [Planctomycetota bacterium]
MRRFPVLVLSLLPCLCACNALDRARGGTPREVEATEASSNYAGADLSFTYFATWTLEPAADGAGGDTVRLRGPEGYHLELRVLRNQPDPGAQPKLVVEALRKGAERLAARPHEVMLAGREAKGLRFSFDTPKRAMAGWVVSLTEGDAELCVLAQWPANAPRAQQAELETVLRSLRWKVLERHASTAP